MPTTAAPNMFGTTNCIFWIISIFSTKRASWLLFGRCNYSSYNTITTLQLYIRHTLLRHLFLYDDDMMCGRSQSIHNVRANLKRCLISHSPHSKQNPFLFYFCCEKKFPSIKGQTLKNNACTYTSVIFTNSIVHPIVIISIS